MVRVILTQSITVNIIRQIWNCNLHIICSKYISANAKSSHCFKNTVTHLCLCICTVIYALVNVFVPLVFIILFLILLVQNFSMLKYMW